MTGNQASTDRGSLGYLILICVVAALGGFLFGFDTAVISGAEPLFTREFNLGPKMEGFVTSSAIVGCFVGALAAGMLTDLFGRKKVLSLSAVLFVASAAWCWVAGGPVELVLARLLGGLGIGIASLTSPLYIAEVSPPRSRGRLVALQQLAIVLGILGAFFSNSVVNGLGFADAAKWRLMFGVAALPAVLFFALIFLVPESPRWLSKQGFDPKAFDILARVAGQVEARIALDQIRQAIAQEGGALNDLIRPGVRRALFLGVILAVFTQITGINAIMYYAPKVFTEAGFGTSAAYWCSVFVGLTNLVFTVASMTVVDFLGRKPLLLSGATCMGIALIFVGWGFQARLGGPALLGGVLSYVASFAFSMGVVGWVVISEIYPTRIRGRAMSVATSGVWASCYMVSVTFPWLLSRIGSAWTFWTYALMCVGAVVFVALFVPETKGRTLEEIEQSWASGALSANGMQTGRLDRS